MKIRNIEVGNIRGWAGREMSTRMQLSKLNLIQISLCLLAPRNIFTNYITCCDVFQLEPVVVVFSKSAVLLQRCHYLSVEQNRTEQSIQCYCTKT